MAAKIGEDRREFVTFDEVSEAYQTWLRHNGKTEAQSVLLTVLSRFFGPVPVCLIDAKKVEEYRAWRQAGNGARSPATWTRNKRVRGRPSDATLYREIAVLQAMLRWGHKHDQVPEGTKLTFAKGLQGDARAVFLEQDEMADLLARAARTSEGKDRLTRIHRFVWLALYTGARCEALEELEWSRVDFGRRVIHLRRPGTRNSNKPRPTVPILEPLLPMLMTARAQAVGPRVLDGGVIRSSWAPFVRTTPYHADRDLHIHDLRRSFFTMLVTNGMPLADISLTYEISLGVLMKHYAKYASGMGTRVAGYVTVRPAALPVLREVAA